MKESKCILHLLLKPKLKLHNNLQVPANSREHEVTPAVLHWEAGDGGGRNDGGKMWAAYSPWAGQVARHFLILSRYNRLMALILWGL